MPMAYRFTHPVSLGVGSSQAGDLGFARLTAQ